MSPVKSPTYEKNLALEGVRGLASLTVVICHFTFVFLPYLGTLFTPVAGATARSGFEVVASYPPFTLLYSGEAAVCVFFVLSGYVLATKFFGTEDVAVLQLAAAKRYVRLALPVAGSVFFAWLLLKWGTIQTKHGAEIGVAGWVPSWYREKFNFFEMLWNGFVGAPLFGQTQLNPPAWTIQVELLGSVILFSLLSTFGKRPLLLFFWAAIFCNILGFRHPNILFYLSFFAGASLNQARPWLRTNQTISAALIGLGLVGLAYNLSPVFDAIRLVSLPNLTPLSANFGDNPRLFWNTVGAIALVAGIIGNAKADKILSTRVPVFLGKVSYSMYLIHMPILMSLTLWVAKVAVKSEFGYHQATLISFIIYLPVVLIGAQLFYQFVDVPSTRLAARLASKPPLLASLQRKIKLFRRLKETERPAT